MKNIIAIFTLLLSSTTLLAQAPDLMSYQAVVRDGGGVLITNTTVGVQISILETTAVGTAVYVETHTPMTNDNGLFSIEIGNGTPVSGAFSGIDWVNDLHFLKSEVDPAGGTSYTISGTNQLLSVPYALNAATVVKGNSLDEAYNEETTINPTTRVIEVDDGPIEIQAIGYVGLNIEGSNIASALTVNSDSTEDAVVISQSGAGRGLEIDHDGTGSGIRVVVSDPANNANAIFLRNQGLGYGLQVTNENAANDRNALYLVNSGTGKAVSIRQLNAASPQSAFQMTNDGLGRAMRLTSTNPANAANVFDARGFGTGTIGSFVNDGTGIGVRIRMNNGLGAANGMRIDQDGTGDAVFLNNLGFGKGLLAFNGNPDNPEAALVGSTSGMGSAGVFNTDDNNGNGEPTLLGMNNASGPVARLITTDEIAGKVNTAPTLDVLTNGLGAGISVNVMNPLMGPDANLEPGLRVTHEGMGKGGLFETTNPLNTSPTVEILNTGEGSALNIDMFGNPGGPIATALVVEQGNSSPAAGSGYAASFALSDVTTAADTGVLITSDGDFVGHSALRVIATSILSNAADFEGKVEIGDDLEVDGTTFSTFLDIADTAFIDTAVITDLTVTGSITAPAKSFKIDHPLDPENQFLIHNSIESNERINIYSGNVITDAEGYATVMLPEYMSALNSDFKYQLTIVDKSFARAVIWEPMNAETNSFVIRTDSPEITVSWQLTGTRKDQWALDNPMEVEVLKSNDN